MIDFFYVIEDVKALSEQLNGEFNETPCYNVELNVYLRSTEPGT